MTPCRKDPLSVEDFTEWIELGEVCMYVRTYIHTYVPTTVMFVYVFYGAHTYIVVKSSLISSDPTPIQLLLEADVVLKKYLAPITHTVA